MTQRDYTEWQRILEMVLKSYDGERSFACLVGVE
jgi:hypothetical protein